VDEQHEDADEPLVGQVAEADQEDRHAVVQCEFEEVALGVHESMPQQAA
jgi:hypothetical protein